MIIGSEKFIKDTLSNNTSIFPLIVMTKTMDPLEWVHRISTHNIRFNDEHYKPLLLNINSVRESVDVVTRKFKISNLSLTCSNVEYEASGRLSDNTNDIMNSRCNIYWKTPTSESIDECLKVYTGKVRNVTHTDTRCIITVEDVSQENLHKDLPIKKIPYSEVLEDKYKNKPYPMVYGEVNDSKLIVIPADDGSSDLIGYPDDIENHEIVGYKSVSKPLKSYADGVKYKILEQSTLLTYPDSTQYLVDESDSSIRFPVLYEMGEDADEALIPQTPVSANEVQAETMDTSNTYDIHDEYTYIHNFNGPFWRNENKMMIPEGATSLKDDDDYSGVKIVDDVDFTGEDGNVYNGLEHGICEISSHNATQNHLSYYPWVYWQAKIFNRLTILNDNNFRFLGVTWNYKAKYNYIEEYDADNWFFDAIGSSNPAKMRTRIYIHTYYGEVIALNTIDDWKWNPIMTGHDGTTRFLEASVTSDNYDLVDMISSEVRIYIEDVDAGLDGTFIGNVDIYQYDTLSSGALQNFKSQDIFADVIGRKGVEGVDYLFENARLANTGVTCIMYRTVGNEAYVYIDWESYPFFGNNLQEGDYIGFSGEHDVLTIPYESYEIDWIVVGYDNSDSSPILPGRRVTIIRLADNSFNWMAPYLVMTADLLITKKHIELPCDIIRHILIHEMGYTGGINEEELQVARDNHIGFYHSFSQTDNINSKTLIEKIARESKLFPKFRNDGTFGFNTIKDSYDGSEATVIEVDEIIDYKFSRTPLQDVKTKVKVIYGKDAVTGDYLKTTEYFTTEDLLGLHQFHKLYYGLEEDDRISTLDFTADFIQDDITAYRLRNWLLVYNLNQKNIVEIKLPIRYMKYEVGDIIMFDKLINNVKLYGENYTASVYRNEQLIYPYFMVHETVKQPTSVTLKLMQLHNNEILFDYDEIELNVKPPIHDDFIQELDNVIDVGDLDPIIEEEPTGKQKVMGPFPKKPQQGTSK